MDSTWASPVSGQRKLTIRFSMTSTGATNTATVQVANNEFLPEHLQVKAGGTVTFVWLSGSGPHNVTPVAGMRGSVTVLP